MKMSKVSAKREGILDIVEIGRVYRARRMGDVDIPVRAKVESEVGRVNLIGVLRMDDSTEELYIESGSRGIKTSVRPNGDGRHVFVGEHKALLFLREADQVVGRMRGRAKQ